MGGLVGALSSLVAWIIFLLLLPSGGRDWGLFRVLNRFVVHFERCSKKTIEWSVGAGRLAPCMQDFHDAMSAAARSSPVCMGLWLSLAVREMGPEIQLWCMEIIWRC